MSGCIRGSRKVAISMDNSGMWQHWKCSGVFPFDFFPWLAEVGVQSAIRLVVMNLLVGGGSKHELGCYYFMYCWWILDVLAVRRCQFGFLLVLWRLALFSSWDRQTQNRADGDDDRFPRE